MSLLDVETFKNDWLAAVLRGIKAGEQARANSGEKKNDELILC